MEGDEEERRAAAREAAGAGENPGARNETTGATSRGRIRATAVP
ncbi:hypothetical protein [Streptomyces nigra]|uniref:Uncharacterized protein n=1 Tax=Streptomyces nigra TaxID=1827580 RepID=A0ABZ1J575_9ACTN